MCCDDKCFFIRVRTASLIFGYIAAVLSGVGVLTFVSLLFYHMTYMMVYNGNQMLDYGAAFSTWQICLLLCTAGFTCAVLLLYGITNNKPVLVKTYVIYGMLQFVFLFIVGIILCCVAILLAGILVMFGCGIYLACLYMVYLTYKEMVATSGGNVFSHPSNLIMA